MKFLTTLLSLFITAGALQAQTFTVLTNFSDALGDVPINNLIATNGQIYGTTRYGGAGSSGAVFAMNTDGTGFTNLHLFDSWNPVNGVNVDGHGGKYLVQSGTNFFGVTWEGGPNAQGTVFRLNQDGTGFTVLHGFQALPPQTFPPVALINAEGASPVAIVVNGGVIYGSASGGGESGTGILFILNTDGTGFTVLHHFEAFSDSINGINNGGSGPSSLFLVGNVLYGTTGAGGSHGKGVFFKINTDGTGFTPLYEFGSVGEPIWPNNPLLLLGDTFYSITSYGGAFGQGSIFSIKTNGTAFTILKNFSSLTQNPDTQQMTNSDGATPTGNLAVYNGRLYGVAEQGGAASYGTAYQIDTDGSNFQVLKTFTRGLDGGGPVSLVVSGPVGLTDLALIGATGDGGLNAYGTLFSLQVAAKTSPVTNAPVPPLNLGHVLQFQEQVLNFTNGNQVFHVTNHISVPALAVTWSLGDGLNHTLLSSPDLRNPVANWSPVPPNWTNGMDVGYVIDINAATRQFFWLKQ